MLSNIDDWVTDPRRMDIMVWAWHQLRKKPEAICPACRNGKRVKLPDGKKYLCPCGEVRTYLSQSALWQTLSKLEIGESLARFDQLTRHSAYTDKGWAELQKAREQLEKLVAKPFSSQWLVLYGELGCGKTHLMLSAYNLLNDVAMYASVTDLQFDVYTKVKEKEGDALGDYQNALQEAPVLFLDDLGKERNTEFLQSILQGVVFHRWNAKWRRPTIISTNLSLDAIRERYGAMGSRLVDTSLALVAPIHLPDHRKLKPDAKKD